MSLSIDQEDGWQRYRGVSPPSSQKRLAVAVVICGSAVFSPRQCMYIYIYIYIYEVFNGGIILEEGRNIPPSPLQKMEMEMEMRRRKTKQRKRRESERRRGERGDLPQRERSGAKHRSLHRLVSISLTGRRTHAYVSL